MHNDTEVCDGCGELFGADEEGATSATIMLGDGTIDDRLSFCPACSASTEQMYEDAARDLGLIAQDEADALAAMTS